MKTRKYFFAVLMLVGIMSIATGNIFAQSPKKEKAKTEKPSWEPSNGYKESVTNIYFPEQDMYFNIKKNVYIYQSKGKWVESKSVPSSYSKVDFNKATKVQLTDKTNKPQKNNTEHKSQYSKSNKKK